MTKIAIFSVAIRLEAQSTFSSWVEHTVTIKKQNSSTRYWQLRILKGDNRKFEMIVG